MLEELMLKGATLYPGEAPLDVRIRAGRIAEIGPDLSPGAGARVVPLPEGCLTVPAFADLHVHLREPGRPDKETIRTGTLAAARGGYTLVCAMPNLDPVPDTPEHLAREEAILRRDAVVTVLPYGAITLGREGRELVDLHALKGRCCAFSDDGSGIQSEALMRRAMVTAAREGVILAAHCEDTSLLNGGYIHDGRYARAHGHKGICSESEWGPIRRDLLLCEETLCRYHVCHVSTKESVALIREAKRRGVPVTCETAPHYLILCEDDLQEDGRFKMNPPLRTAADRDALVEGLRDGTIDAVATDHAPHTAAEKALGLADSAMGIVGLETAFPVLYTKLVRTGLVPLDRLLDALSGAPRRIFGLPGGSVGCGARADLAVLDLDAPYRIDSRTFLSKGKATPFDGWEVRGEVRLTLHQGKVIYNKDIL